MEPKIVRKPPSRNIDVNQINSCTLCPFKSHVKSTFQRHLMKSHGLKLKNLEADTVGEYATLGRVANDYGLNEKFETKEEFRHSCPRCLKKFPAYRTAQYHKRSCKQAFKRLKGADPFFCSHCDGVFASQKLLNRHLEVCGKKKDICCQICAFKCFSKSRIERHLIDRHNLICKLVQEPDFEQALNGTPYTLERAVEFEALPGVAEVKALPNDELLRTGVRLPDPVKEATKRYKKTMTCDQCNQEFMKLRHLNKHKKYDNCGSKG